MSKTDIFRRPAWSPWAGVAAAALVCAAQPAAATTLFTGASTSGGFTLSEPIGHDFSFGFYDVQIHGQCNTCITASAPDGSPLGTFNFETVSGPFNYITNPAGTTQPALPAGGGMYSEHFEGYGTFDINPPASGPALLGGGSNYFGVTVFATPGASAVTFEFDLDQYATSDLVNLGTKPLYLDITGSTASPVTLASLTGDVSPIYAFAAPLSVDFTMKLTDVPYSPTIGGVPEPQTWSLMLAGFGALGAGLRARRRGRTVLA